jgi:hypothetical protein
MYELFEAEYMMQSVGGILLFLITRQSDQSVRDNYFVQVIKKILELG